MLAAFIDAGGVCHLVSEPDWAGDRWALKFSFGGTAVISDNFSALLDETMFHLMTFMGSSPSFEIEPVAGILPG